jgi:hypothetical protein
MSKPLAGFYGQKSIRRSQQPKPQEYTVLGINQPLIPPDEAPMILAEAHPVVTSGKNGGQRGFLVSLLLDR